MLWNITGTSINGSNPVRLRIKADTHNEAVRLASRRVCVHSCGLHTPDEEKATQRAAAIRAAHLLTR